MLDLNNHHVGRSWAPQHDVEDNCPCPQQPCGLVLGGGISPDCPEHHWSAAKSMRQMHPAEKCPGKR